MTMGIVIAVCLTGWMVGSRIALQGLMNRPVCPRGMLYRELCREIHGRECARPVGEVRERTLFDACLALGLGLTWPILIAARLLSAATPATPGEHTRKLKQQQREIKKLNDQIDEAHRALGVR